MVRARNVCLSLCFFGAYISSSPVVSGLFYTSAGSPGTGGSGEDFWNSPIVDLLILKLRCGVEFAALSGHHL